LWALISFFTPFPEREVEGDHASPQPAQNSELGQICACRRTHRLQRAPEVRNFHVHVASQRIRGPPTDAAPSGLTLKNSWRRHLQQGIVLYTGICFACPDHFICSNTFFAINQSFLMSHHFYKIRYFSHSPHCKFNYLVLFLFYNNLNKVEYNLLCTETRHLYIVWSLHNGWQMCAGPVVGIVADVPLHDPVEVGCLCQTLSSPFPMQRRQMAPPVAGFAHFGHPEAELAEKFVP
jgi:hypothetical protein